MPGIVSIFTPLRGRRKRYAVVHGGLNVGLNLVVSRDAHRIAITRDDDEMSESREPDGLTERTDRLPQ